MSEVSDEEFINQINEMRKTLLSMIDGEEIDGEVRDNLNINFSDLDEIVFNPPINKIVLKYKSPYDLFYNYDTDSGFDLYSTEDIIIPPFGRVLVPTGTYFDIPQGHEIQIRSKSGLACAPTPMARPVKVWVIGIFLEMRLTLVLRFPTRLVNIFMFG